MKSPNPGTYGSGTDAAGLIVGAGLLAATAVFTATRAVRIVEGMGKNMVKVFAISESPEFVNVLPSNRRTYGGRLRTALLSRTRALSHRIQSTEGRRRIEKRQALRKA